MFKSNKIAAYFIRKTTLISWQIIIVIFQNQIYQMKMKSQ